MGKLVEDYNFVGYLEERHYDLSSLTREGIVEEFERLLDSKGVNYRSRKIVDSIKRIRQSSLLMLLNWIVENVTDGDITKGYKLLSETDVMKEMNDINSSYPFLFDSKLLNILKEELKEKAIIE